MEFHNTSTTAIRILHQTSITLLQKAIHATRKQYIDAYLLTLHIKLSNSIHITVWQLVKQLLHYLAETEASIKEDLQKKYEHVAVKRKMWIQQYQRLSTGCTQHFRPDVE